MIQISQPLPADVPVCQPGHRPQLVRTRGAPVYGHQVGTPCPDLWHVECHACGCATTPHPSRAISEGRWRAAQRFPLSQLRYARDCAAVAIAA